MRLLIIATLLFFATQAVGQLSVKVVDASGKTDSVSNATVTLFSIADSLPRQHGATDLHGFVQLDSPGDGTYFMVASCVGYEKKRTLDFTIEKNRVPFDTLIIRLIATSVVMENVIATAHRPLIENHIDKMVLNVDAMLNNSASNLLEVLSNAPGVDVDISGTISLRGKQGVVILIDGKQSYLSGPDMANYLNSIPASLVDQIEVMTQPSAKYDAGGNAGVINIILKKNRQMGFNGNISVSYAESIYPKTLNTIILNYRINKWNFFMSADINYVKRYTRRNLSRYIQNDTDASLIQYHQDENDVSIAPDHSILVGVDYFVNKNSTFTATLYSKVSRQRDEITDHSSFNDLTKDGKVISYLNDFNLLNNPWDNTEGILSYKNNHARNSLSFDVSYDIYHFRSSQWSTATSLDSSGSILTGPMNPYIQMAILPTDINLLSAKADDEYSFKNSKLGFGVKSSIIFSKNQSSFYSAENGQYLIDRNLSNSYHYRENINAAYLNYRWQNKHWEWQAGVRVEGTNSRGVQDVNSESFSKYYLQIFPTLYFGYSLDKQNHLAMSYGRRIDRPNYTDLNPFIYLIDPYDYRKGNPQLQPYFTNTLEVDYNYKSNLNLVMGYSKTSGIIDITYTQNDSTKILVQSKANLDQLSSVSFNGNYNSHIKNWSTILLSYSVFNNHYSGTNNNVPFNRSITTHLINYNQQFRFRKTWLAEINIVYRSPILLSSTTVRYARKISGFAVGKEMFNGHSTLKVRISDPLLIQRSGGYTIIGEIYSTTMFREDSRRIGLTFTYRFQKGIKTAQHKQYNLDEKNRILTN